MDDKYYWICQNMYCPSVNQMYKKKNYNNVIWQHKKYEMKYISLS